MKIINNTDKIITLVNGKKVSRYSSLIITAKTEDLMQQLEGLTKLGLVRVEFQHIFGNRSHVNDLRGFVRMFHGWDK